MPQVSVESILGFWCVQPVFATSIDDKYTRLSRHSTWMLQPTGAARFLILTAVSVFNTRVHSTIIPSRAEMISPTSSATLRSPTSSAALSFQTFQFSFSVPNASNQLSVIVATTDLQVLTAQDISFH